MARPRSSAPIAAARSADTLLLEATLDSMPYGFSIWDDRERLVLCNRRYLQLYGLPGERFVPGISLAEACAVSVAAGNHPGTSPAELLTEYQRRLHKAAEAPTPLVFEKHIYGRTIKTTYSPTPGLGCIVTHEDVTEEKDRLNALRQRESELAHQNMRFAAAVENMSQGLCMFDRDQRLVICNARYADLYGLPHDLVKPGTPLQEILQNRIKRGVVPVTGPQAYIQRRLELVTERKEATDVVELADGRVIAVLHHPMSDGGWVSTHQDISEERRNQARIRHLARHDALTDLPNRVHFRERMEAAEGRIHRGERMAVLWVDLDHFKGVNDLFGHAVGDAVLCAAGERLRGSCRDEDVVARLGGDEFALLHGPLGEAKDAAAAADRIVKAMAEPFDIANHHILIGASVGIAVAPGDGSAPEALMKNADMALYRAKAEGGGSYHFFEPGMDAALQERLALEIGLRAALAGGELSLVFQPLFSLKDNAICAMEALLRWNHRERGTIMPSVIIPIAEETGLIVAIGEWVLREACTASMGWPPHVNIAVNLSPVQFKNRHLIEHVTAALAGTGLRPERLELEITESVLLADSEPTLHTLHELRRLGVRISMDDFGTGYSSLSYLRSFPFDKIKIDQSFVQDLSKRGDSLAIVNAVIGLGRSLGMTTTAEGIETQDQLDLVRQQGCSEVQGYLFSPPLPASAAALLFQRKNEPQIADLAAAS
jgi:diguanylate cyclase (GGDEF)-like protein